MNAKQAAQSAAITILNDLANRGGFEAIDEIRDDEETWVEVRDSIAAVILASGPYKGLPPRRATEGCILPPRGSTGRLEALRDAVEQRRAAYPPEAKTLDELNAAIQHARNPIEWDERSAGMDCGSQDAMYENQQDRIAYLEELADLHRSSATHRRMVEMLRDPLERETVAWILGAM